MSLGLVFEKVLRKQQSVGGRADRAVSIGV